MPDKPHGTAATKLLLIGVLAVIVGGLTFFITVGLLHR
jgi:hypothetical protein